MNGSKVSIGLVNPKSATNVGAVIRAVNCFQADEVFYTGTRYEKSARFHTDTKGAVDYISLTGVDDLMSEIRPGQQIICVDLVEGAQPLHEFQHPDSAFYVFGPEDGSINQALIDQADAVVYVPTKGCLNLAAAVNVLLYDRTSKLGSLTPGDELILSSRDTNNRTKAKPSLVAG